MPRTIRPLGACSCCREACVGQCIFTPLPRYLYLTFTEWVDGTGFSLPNLVGHSLRLGVPSPVAGDPGPPGGCYSTSNIPSIPYYGTSYTTFIVGTDPDIGNLYIDVDWWAVVICCNDYPTTGTGTLENPNCDNTPGVSSFMQFFSHTDLSPTPTPYFDAISVPTHAPGSDACSKFSIMAIKTLDYRQIISCNPYLSQFRHKLWANFGAIDGSTYNIQSSWVLTK